MVTVAYDQQVRDLIAGLDATGHVTHTQHRKDMVTVHHNGGRLSHDGVLSVWQTRPASAHFDVDAYGGVAQYVRVNEYAWATGNTAGNQRSISIEMCNSGVGGDWPVSETTWRSAARLAGWLFARVIGTRPNTGNLVQHKFWSSTDCAGPYMGRVWGEFIAEAQRAYDSFAGGGAPSTPPPSGGGGKSINEIAREVIAGNWGNGDDRRRRLEGAGYNYGQVQDEVNRILGAGSSAPAPSGKSIAQLADEVLMGQWGNDPQRRQSLQAAGYDADAVQAEVNRRLGGGAPSAGPAPSLRQIAADVIRGNWGNGDERRQRLTAAGYNYDQVQAEVNRQLGF